MFTFESNIASFYPYALKGQKLLAQGSALGNKGRKPVALKGQKLSIIRQYTKLLPLQGALLNAVIPRAMPWARSFCPFRACGEIIPNPVRAYDRTFVDGGLQIRRDA